MPSPTSSLQAVRAELARLPAPVILFNKSHSGSRLLARLVEEGGIFLGAHQNESRDSLDLLRLVEYLVGRYYPDYGPLWNPAGVQDAQLADLLREVFAAHLEGLPPGRRWGWKLCETAYILPVLDNLFPGAHYIHLLRDGRDVAFCDHTSPAPAFWRKIYFNTDRIESWHGRRLDPRAYEERSYVYNALHWVNSVSVGRAYGAMLRERYFEVRYEDLCRGFAPTARRVLEFIAAPQLEEALERVRAEVYEGSVAKHRAQPPGRMREVIEIEKALLLALGYLEADPFPPPSRSYGRRLKAWWRRRAALFKKRVA
jgi:hypothetical protein